MCDVGRKSIAEDISGVISYLLTLTAVAGIRVEVEYNGGTLHQCGLINHGPPSHYGWRGCFVFVWSGVCWFSRTARMSS